MPVAIAADPDATAFDLYAARYRSAFGRADQYARFRLYLQGLIAPGERKNLEAIASAVGGAASGSDRAQSLQHFVSHSPWEAGRVFAAYRQHLREIVPDPAASWVIHDEAFPKKGRHSVGVQRQFARAVGRKINCQVAVVVSRVGPKGAFPLAARLYLPAAWLRDHRDGAGLLLPAEFREPIAKPAVALGLIDELLTEGERPLRIEAEDGYGSASAFVEGLAARTLKLDGEAGSIFAVGSARRRLDEMNTRLGLGHFEGRSWVGWHHHVSLVFAASGYTISGE